MTGGRWLSKTLCSVIPNAERNLLRRSVSILLAPGHGFDLVRETNMVARYVTGTGLKRLTCPWRGEFRIETHFTYKAEQSDSRFGALDAHSLASR